MKVFIVLSALVAAAIAMPAGPIHPAPVHGGPAYNEAPAVYQYAYSVLDDYSGNNFGQNEARDGYSTQGEYHVLLPDGRVQTVRYSVADAYSGYVADVSYSGEARPYAPAPHGPAPLAPIAHGPIRRPHV